MGKSQFSLNHDSKLDIKEVDQSSTEKNSTNSSRWYRNRDYPKSFTRDRSKSPPNGNKLAPLNVSLERSKRVHDQRVSKPSSRSNSSYNRHTGADLEGKWLKDEDNFALKQIKHKSVIRINDNREEPLDWLVICLKFLDPAAFSDTELIDSLLGLEYRNDIENSYSSMNQNSKSYKTVLNPGKYFSIPEPTSVITHLDKSQLNELIKGIEEFDGLEKERRNKDFWKSILIIATDQLNNADQQSTDNRVVEVVRSDIDNILVGKSFTELLQLETKVNDLLTKNDATIDRDFWLQLSKRLVIDKSKCQILEYYSEVLDMLIKVIEKIQKIQEERLGKERVPDDKFEIYRKGLINAKSNPIQYSSIKRIIKSDLNEESSSSNSNSSFNSINNPFYEVSSEPIKSDEVLFNDEVETSNSDSTLIKPNYHNLVCLGYDWNKYNQAHYNNDNPPPRIPQGYKFNIYYPELIGTSQIPSYTIVKENENENTVILLFKSPSLYKDVAFRIIDLPWDRSSHSNNHYLNQFEEGLLQVHFRFKKIYRK